MGIEKRKERRIKISLPIQISHHNKVIFSGQTENISRLGAYLVSDKKVPTGIDINIKLEISCRQDNPSLAGEIKCWGNVFRCDLISESGKSKNYGVGVFFTDFTKDSDKEKLSNYIDYLILKDGQAVKESLKRWKDKRETAKLTKQDYLKEPKKEVSRQDLFNLLLQVLSRLEELKQLLQAKNKS